MQDIIGGVIRRTANKQGWQIADLEIGANGVILSVGAPPKFSPAGIVSALKRETHRALWGRFPALRSRVSSLWNYAAWIRTVGNPPASGAFQWFLTERGMR
jgi:REP element-mobilizing transposase RayT